LLQDIKTNSDKINHHGKRADAIVKGMLQHSRSSTGQKEPTALNALCDEYLRLAYHGLRAKNPGFKADYATQFDPKIDQVKLQPQEMGRVLLNLINNAFYAVNEKAKSIPDVDYQPLVSLSTQKNQNTIIITVSDNGTGMSPSVQEKIFQPFFTTKPTGQGTGLGLSLSYDIVTKVHGGELSVNSELGEGTSFTIRLPLIV
jgi:signal transduction histidine kinase